MKLSNIIALSEAIPTKSDVLEAIAEESESSSDVVTAAETEEVIEVRAKTPTPPRTTQS